MNHLQLTSDPFRIPALKTFGVFSQPKYYDGVYINPDPNPFHRKTQGGVRPFYAAGGYSKSRAANSDGYFDQFKRTFIGDYDNGLVQRRSASEQRVMKAWVPSAPGKRLCGVGSRFGCFTSIIPYMGNGVRKVQKKEKSLPNFYTNPGKKGSGYGYPDVTINPFPAWKPGDGIFSNLNEVSMREINKKHIKKCLGRAPFISAQASGRSFYQNPYEGVDPLASGGRPVINFREKESSKNQKTGPIFYPSKAFTAHDYPEYMSEPYLELGKIWEKRGRSEIPRGKPIWYPPASTALEKPSMSVMNKNIDLAINPATRKTRKFVSNICENK